jgi:hypothetical protein
VRLRPVTVPAILGGVQPSTSTQKSAGPAANPRRKRCLNCLNLFRVDPRLNTPARIAKGCEPKFCCDDCRKEWHRNGGVSFSRQKSVIEALVRRRLESHLQEIRMKLDQLKSRVVEINRNILEIQLKQAETSKVVNALASKVSW